MNEECIERLEKIKNGFKECRGAFTAIGDPTRQVIILVLLESDLSGIRVNEIAKKAHLTRPSVSHHLKILKDAGIINVRREGTKNYYYLSTDDTKWKDFVELVNLIYSGIKCLGEKESHKVNRKDEFEKTLFNRENAE